MMGTITAECFCVSGPHSAVAIRAHLQSTFHLTTPQFVTACRTCGLSDEWATLILLASRQEVTVGSCRVSDHTCSGPDRRHVAAVAGSTSTSL